ncbi:MAG: methyltransferase domain-containing protein, partial [Phycisphaerae bacterium]
MKLASALQFGMLCVAFAVRDAIRPRLRILREVPLREGFHVLDYGCGPGGYVAPLAQLVGPGGRVYALDVNPLAVRRVGRIARRRRLANVEPIL